MENTAVWHEFIKAVATEYRRHLNMQDSASSVCSRQAAMVLGTASSVSLTMLQKGMMRMNRDADATRQRSNNAITPCGVDYILSRQYFLLFPKIARQIQAYWAELALRPMVRCSPTFVLHEKNKAEQQRGTCSSFRRALKPYPNTSWEGLWRRENVRSMRQLGEAVPVWMHTYYMQKSVETAVSRRVLWLSHNISDISNYCLYELPTHRTPISMENPRESRPICFLDVDVISSRLRETVCCQASAGTIRRLRLRDRYSGQKQNVAQQ